MVFALLSGFLVFEICQFSFIFLVEKYFAPPLPLPHPPKDILGMPTRDWTYMT
jgi:hypothetical protein